MTRSSAFLLSLLLTACGTVRAHHGRELHDGVEVETPPVFVTPGYTPAGAGLPEYRPTEETPVVERGPHARVLPQTPASRREPGLWSGAQPQAAAVPGIRAEIAGVLIPYPDEANTAKKRAATDVCVGTMNEALAGINSYILVASLKEPWKSCFASSLFRYCAVKIRERYVRAKSSGNEYDADEYAQIMDMAKHAIHLSDRLCSGVMMDDSQHDVFDAIIHRWEAEVLHG